MKLQEFLSFRKKCFICGGPITFKVTDWTDFKTPTTMTIAQISSLRLIKLAHKDLSIFINVHENTFNIFPNVSREIELEMEACCKNQDHYGYDTQALILNYKEKTWSPISDIEVQEIIQIGQDGIFSVINSYHNKSTTVIMSGLNESFSDRVDLPLIDTGSVSLNDMKDKLKLYITFS